MVDGEVVQSKKSFMGMPVSFARLHPTPVAQYIVATMHYRDSITGLLRDAKALPNWHILFASCKAHRQNVATGDDRNNFTVI